MQLILVPEAEEGGANGTACLLRYAWSTSPVKDVLLSGLDHLWRCQRTSDLAARLRWTKPTDSWWAFPEAWRIEPGAGSGPALAGSGALPATVRELDMHGAKPWVVVTNGRFATCINCRLLDRVLGMTHAKVLAVTAAPDQMAYQETVRLTSDNTLVGYRRLYADAMMPIPIAQPHHLFIRRDAYEAIVGDGLPSDFDALIDRARPMGIESVAVAGTALDLGTAEGILTLCRAALDNLATAGDTAEAARQSESSDLPQAAMGSRPRLIGPVLLGERVTIEPGAVIIGPSVVCDDAVVRRDALVDSAIVGANATINAGETVRDCVVSVSEQGQRRTTGQGRRGPRKHVCPGRRGIFRTWPRLSYAGGVKRVCDVAAALLVLVLFAPVIPVLALAIKLNSRGPVFFRHRRQGLHGVPFACIKFRTMTHGADQIQEKLRHVCEVDGPQFKMADDPRITSVGRFLRETYLDEIPQFLNVLRGHMSVVGPRPSPEAENTLCPSWRDARLSVRPGITGLWQVCRTREAHRDFQEWIHYDMQYVRDLSLRLDLWICWRTFKKMAADFIRQF